MGFMIWSVVSVVAPVVIMVVIMSPIAVVVVMIPVMAPSLVVFVVSPSVMVIMVVFVVSPSIVVIVMIIVMVIMVNIVMFSMVWSIWVYYSLSMLWCLLFLFSWLWCFLLWLFFSRFLLLLSLFSVHVSLIEERNSIHLLSKENLGKGKTKRVSEFIVMLVLPLGHSIHEFMVYILSIYNQVVINMEDEIPWVSKGLGHRFKFIEISSNCSLALFKLASNIVDDGAHVFNCMENAIKSCVSKFINNSTNSLPNVFGITKALDSMWDFSLNRSSKKTFEDLSHSEEREMDVGALHGLEFVHLIIFLVVNLIEKGLPMVIEIEEEFFVFNHLGLSVKKHSSSLSEMFT